MMILVKMGKKEKENSLRKQRKPKTQKHFLSQEWKRISPEVFLVSTWRFQLENLAIKANKCENKKKIGMGHISFIRVFICCACWFNKASEGGKIYKRYASYCSFIYVVFVVVCFFIYLLFFSRVFICLFIHVSRVENKVNPTIQMTIPTLAFNAILKYNMNVERIFKQRFFFLDQNKSDHDFLSC